MSLSSVEFGGTKVQWEAVKGKLNLLVEYIPAKSVKCADGEWRKPVLLVENGVVVKCFEKTVTSVEIPASVTEIGKKAFRDCSSLSSVEFGGTKAQWEAVKEKPNLLGYVPAKSVKCADGEWQKPVVFVENGVVVECFDETVPSVEIPVGVTEIGNEAFMYCKSLSEITFGGTKAQWEAVEKGNDWNEGFPAKSVKCADGNAEL